MNTATVAELLRQWSDGDPRVAERVVPLLYRELKSIAARLLRHDAVDHTLQPTALVNELYLRLREVRGVSWCDRQQFLGFAAHLMRRMLVQHARRKAAEKRGGTLRRTTLSAIELATFPTLDLLALDRSLKELRRLDPRKAGVVELRFFGGLTVEETAEVLALSPATVEREWRRARAWLYRELGGEARFRDEP